MGFNEFLTAEGKLTTGIISVNQRIRQHIAGEIDGISINKIDVMDKAKNMQTSILSDWNNYKQELQQQVN